MHTTIRQRGFTLIELLVVIMIIGLLTGLAATSYVNAQKNARDNARKTNVGSIATAVETFYRANQRFPGKILPSGYSGATSVDGCASFDASKRVITYYYSPGISCNSVAVNESSYQYNGESYFKKSDYNNSQAWLPEIGSYLSPVPVETRNEVNPATSAWYSGSFRNIIDTSGILSYMYVRLDGGYMVYAQLENGSSSDKDVLPNDRATTFDSAPKYPNESSVTVAARTITSNRVYLIRK